MAEAAVVDETAAANGVSALPEPVELDEHQAATSTPIHSVTGAIMRRSMRLVDFFENYPDAIDALVEFLTATSVFMQITKAEAKDIEVQIDSTLTPNAGSMILVTTFRRK